MTRRPSTFRQADVTRAVKAARAAGLHIRSVEVTQGGSIRIITAEQSAPAANQLPFDSWKAKRDASSVEGA